MVLKEMFSAAIDVLLPRTCSVCGETLATDESYMCRRCLMELPRTHFEGIPFNAMEQLFAGKVPIERAAAYFFYEKKDAYAEILHDLKYHNMPLMARWLSAHAARQLAPSGLWQGIDYLLPVPLYITRLAKRGYNQSRYIALGISDYTDVPVYEALRAVKSHSSQTRKGILDRYMATRGLYAMTSEATRELQGKHVMIVDDVVTTGATLLACAESLAAVPGIKISLFTLAASKIS